MERNGPPRSSPGESSRNLAVEPKPRLEDRWSEALRSIAGASCVHRGARPSSLARAASPALASLGLPKAWIRVVASSVSAIGARGPLAHHVHVELHRRRVWMDLRDGHVRTVRIAVLVEGEQTRL